MVTRKATDQPDIGLTVSKIEKRLTIDRCMSMCYQLIIINYVGGKHNPLT